jgi:DNA polymerase I-like protein with 3'-5' exonuclease and polymerase domains
MNRPLVIDVETTISNNGNPFDETNRLIVTGLKFIGHSPKLIWTDDLDQTVQHAINDCTFLVLFNAKFDLHWLRKHGYVFGHKRIWDCQLGEFILNYQESQYPSLDEALAKYGAEPKLDVVKKEYWEKGIDTDQVPRDILSEYLEGDLDKTEFVFKKQWDIFKTDGRYSLFKLQCKDLLTLEEMEWNGIKFNSEKARARAELISQELDLLIMELGEFARGVPININSNDHLSCLLYGGTIVEDYRIPIGVFKTGAKTGETRYKVLQKEYKLERLIEPLKGSETKKEGYWKVNDDILRALKTNSKSKQLIELIKQHNKLEKLRGTYLIGWSNLIGKMHWPMDTIHGSLNQCRAITGRLSSDNPNLQNADPTTKIYCESRYD